MSDYLCKTSLNQQIRIIRKVKKGYRKTNSKKRGIIMNTVNHNQQNMHIKVQQGNWGDAQIVDITKLLIDTASHINQHLRRPFDETIHVMPGDYPIALIRDSVRDPYIIKLSARDTKWNQYAYQFAHEFCHVLSNYEDLEDHPNNWFHEGICEMASIFTLKCMAKRWREGEPPYPHWTSYADKLDAYWHKTQSRLGTKLQEGVTLNSWLLDNEDMLRVANYREDKQRINQALVAYKLLDVFEVSPKGWNAIREFPTSKGCLHDYLKEWYLLVDLEDRSFLEFIFEVFDFSVRPNPD